MHFATARICSLVATAYLLVASASAQAQSKITVYSAGPANLIETLSKGFTRATGTQVGVFQGTTGQVMARIEAEAANPVVDVVISASWDTAQDFEARGWSLAYTSPNAATVPDALKSKTAVTQGISALGIAWNPSSGTPRPNDWDDLTKPEYKNLVTIPDPAQSGASFELMAALQARSNGWSLFEALRSNGAIVAGANAQALNPVLQGAKAAVFGAVDYISLDQNAKGESIDVIFPASGTVIAPRPMMVMKASKHQAEAQTFIDYVLSAEGQAAVAKVYLIPGRSDIAASRPILKDLKLLPTDSQVYGRREPLLAGFAQAMAKKP
jgi:iron(III) transport system substrate-binding protein